MSFPCAYLPYSLLSLSHTMNEYVREYKWDKIWERWNMRDGREEWMRKEWMRKEWMREEWVRKE
jgi:hypothetical protein